MCLYRERLVLELIQIQETSTPEVYPGSITEILESNRPKPAEICVSAFISHPLILALQRVIYEIIILKRLN